jgi:hypothetical protein
MSEKLYALLLKLYPAHFRGAYGEEALRLVRERARDEKGFFPRLRLWLDLLVDLARSLPREYGATPTMSTRPMVAAQSVSDEPSFQLLAERPLNPALMAVVGMVSAVLLWACVTVVAHSRTFPVLFRDQLSLQSVVQTDLALARSRAGEEYGVCMTAQRNIPNSSVEPLLTYQFAPPGVSGVALVDGKIVGRFRNEQRVSVRTEVSAGDHRFALHLDSPADYTSMSSSDDLRYCPPE